MSYIFKDHTADIKFIVDSNTLEEAFSDSIKAVSKIILGDNNLKEECCKKEILIKSKNLKRLLYEFIEEILFYFDTEFILPKEIISITITNNDSQFKLESKIGFSKINKAETGIKAITYHEMKIENKTIENKEKCFIEAVVDI